MLHKLLASDGRFIIVGDPFQSLYGFTGATSDGMRLLQTELEAQRLTLSICWRCPRTHLSVAAALCRPALASDEYPIQPRPDAPEGTILNNATFASEPVPAGPAAVLCRYNAPLLQLFRAMLRLGWPVQLAGRADMAGLLTMRLNKALKGLNRAHIRGTGHLKTLLCDDVARLLAKAARVGDDSQYTDKVNAADDESSCLRTLLSELDAPDNEFQLRGESLVEALKRKIKETYGGKDEPCPAGTLLLSTIHKAKGLEWPLVYLLQPGRLFGLTEALQGRFKLLPCNDDWEAAAERNCTYVAVTRSTDTLVVLKHIQSGFGEPFDPSKLLEGSHLRLDHAVRNVRRRLLEPSQQG